MRSHLLSGNFVTCTCGATWNHLFDGCSVEYPGTKVGNMTFDTPFYPKGR